MVSAYFGLTRGTEARQEGLTSAQRALALRPDLPEALTAVAGTHLVSREEAAAALGNIYTRRDRRNRGLGRMVTSAVLHELRDVETIGLNVRADNAAALAVYASLGFVPHRPFYEAVAHPRPHP